MPYQTDWLRLVFGIFCRLKRDMLYTLHLGNRSQRNENRWPVAETIYPDMRR